MISFVNLLAILSCTMGHSDPNLNYTSGDSLTIQYLDLRVNPLLFSEVRKYIKEQQDSCQLFRNGFGFAAIANVKPIRRGIPVPADSLSDHVKDIELEFNIGLSSFYPHQNLGFPLYYSFVGSRLVVIYDQTIKWIHRNTYSISSQRKIKALIEQTLGAVFAANFVFRRIFGEPFTLTVEQRKQMSRNQLLELGSWSLSKLKTVV